jgi:hypothetical protein
VGTYPQLKRYFKIEMRTRKDGKNMKISKVQNTQGAVLHELYGTSTECAEIAGYEVRKTDVI